MLFLILREGYRCIEKETEEGVDSVQILAALV
jgi:hypothetical protein